LNAKQLEQTAVDQVGKAIAENGPREPRIVHCFAENEWNEMLLRQMSDHRLHVLERTGDIVVFYDEEGRQIGWRDDERRGLPRPALAEQELFRLSVAHELELPADTRLGVMRPEELPPVGWTLYAVLIPSPTAGENDIVHVWAEPDSMKVIQCLTGPLSRYRQGGE